VNVLILDRLTGNVTFSTDKMTSTVFGAHDHKGIDWIYHARLLNVDPRDPDWVSFFAAFC
jgi:hypothetical protein